MLGIQLPGEDDALEFQENIQRIVVGLPTILLVCSSGEADLLE